MKRKLTALALVLLAALLAGCGGGGDKTYTIRLGHSDTAVNPLHTNLMEFAKAVSDRTDGRVQIQVFPAGQLGSNAEMFDMVEAGTLDAMILPSGQQAGSASPKLSTISLPFLFSSYEHVDRVLEGEIGAELTDGMSEHNMIQLAYWENGMRQFTNNVRPIETPEDLMGLRFRTPEDAMTQEIFAVFGVSTGTAPLSELYDALRAGEFDGQENPIANIYANNLQNVQKYLTMVYYQYQPKGMVFSLTAWNKLPEEYRDIVREAAVEYGERNRTEIRGGEFSQLGELRAAGMVINYPDTAPFAERTRPVYEAFYERYEWGRDLVERIRALR